MGDWIFEGSGYDGNTPLQKIKDDIAKLESTDNKFFKAREKFPKGEKETRRQHLDTIFALILDTVKDKNKDKDSMPDSNYEKHVMSDGDTHTTWFDNSGLGLFGVRNTPVEARKNVLKELSQHEKNITLNQLAENLKTWYDPNYTGNKEMQDTIHELAKSYKKLRNNDKFAKYGKVILDMLTSRDNGDNGDNNMSNIEDIVREAITENKQVVFTGAPGTGKTYTVTKVVADLLSKQFLSKKFDNSDSTDTEDDYKQSHYKFVQFHSSYDYTDFVEGLRPVPALGGQEGGNSFVRMDGTFKAFCRKIVADNNPEENYYFIIDEINRADLSKVFGELMFGLEETYRGEKHKFETQYQNLPTYYMEDDEAKLYVNDVFKDGFYVPENLYIIGTMNDIDRSVEAFDFALRRRFTWINIKANEIMQSSIYNIVDPKTNSNGALDKIISNIKKMNEVISGTNGRKLGLNEDYCLGPAYFKTFKPLFEGDKQPTKDELSSELDNIWEKRIAPILREYTRGRNQDEVNNFINECEKKLKEDTVAQKEAGTVDEIDDESKDEE